MLKTIISISGKPGLYRLVSQSKNMIIVESLSDGKRMPSHARDKVISLGDIAMYTESGEVPLSQVLESMKAVENGGKASVTSKASTDELRNYFGTILSDFDRERVYPSDIKKLITWYNLLIEAGVTDFRVEETEAPSEDIARSEERRVGKECRI